MEWENQGREGKAARQGMISGPMEGSFSLILQGNFRG